MHHRSCRDTDYAAEDIKICSQAAFQYLLTLVLQPDCLQDLKRASRLSLWTVFELAFHRHSNDFQVRCNAFWQKFRSLKGEDLAPSGRLSCSPCPSSRYLGLSPAATHRVPLHWARPAGRRSGPTRRWSRAPVDYSQR